MHILDLMNLKANSVMTPKPKCVHLNDTMQKVDDILKAHNFHHVPVVDDENRVKGIISAQDVELLRNWASSLHIESAFQKDQQVFSTHLASERMTKQVVTITPDVTLEYCADIFKNNLFHALPVVENEKIIGIVTPLDLIKVAFSKETLTQQLN